MAWTTPKTWTNEPLLASDLNTHMRDNLNELKAPPSDSYLMDEGSDYTTTSTTFVDVDATNLSLTITTNGGDVMVGFYALVSGSGSGTVDPRFDVDVDGARVGGDDGLCGTSTLVKQQIGFVVLIEGLSAASHTFKLQWKTQAAGTITLFAGAGTSNVDLHPQFWVREVS